MDYREIRLLLSKYWEGETTLEDERELTAFFTVHANGLPGDLEDAAPLFRFYGKASLQTTADFEGPWQTAANRTQPTPKILKLLRHYWEYAAIILLMLASVWVFQPGNTPPTQSVAIQDTYQDPEQAMIATQKALEVLAANLNKGKEGMQKLALFHEAQEKIGGE